MNKLSMFVMCVLVSVCSFSYASAPTVPASNINLNPADGSRISGYFTKGNGTSRILVLKEASQVTGTPVNGTEYSFNAGFGSAGSEFPAPGEFVVYRGTSNSFSIDKLKPGTTYFLKIFEYNGTGAGIEYGTTAFTASMSTASTPLIATKGLALSNVTGNSVKLTITAGDGERRIILARKASPVNATPEDLKAYPNNNNFGEGAVLNGDNYLVASGLSSSSVIIGNLEPNATYHFACFEYNGSSNHSPVYIKTAATNSLTTNTGPTSSPGVITFTEKEGNGLKLYFAIGNGTRRLIIAKKGSAPQGIPQNGETYNGSTSFGSGFQIAPDEFVLSSSEASLIIVSNLEPATPYFFRVYEYDVNLSGYTYYLTTSSRTGETSTEQKPTANSTLQITATTGSTASLSFPNGNGKYRMVVMREGSAVTANPTDLTYYTGGNTTFGSGAMLGAGNYIMASNMNGYSLNVTSLKAGVTYHIEVIESNGNKGPVYLTPGAKGSFTISGEPSAPSTQFEVQLAEGNSLKPTWKAGDGARRIVIAQKGAAVTAKPTDGQTYAANSEFSKGVEMESGQFVVYDGTANSFMLTGLEKASSYHLAIFEYNPTSAGPDYRLSSFLQGQVATVSAPGSQVYNIGTSDIKATQATLTFKSGSGARRLFVIREGSPVNAEPEDLKRYEANSNYGSSPIGTGNYVVQLATVEAPFIVSNLKPNTLYHITGFEFNGSLNPVYLRPGNVFSFTTLENTGPVVAPTTPASEPGVTAADGNQFKLGWKNGNGTGRLIIARKGSTVDFRPTDGIVYATDPQFGNGLDLGNGQFAIFDGGLNFVTTINLLPASGYHFAVFEYNGAGANRKYLVSDFLATNGSTLYEPTTGSKEVTSVTSLNSIALSWTVGDGMGRIVVVKEAGALTGSPSNLSVYPANNNFKSGEQITNEEYVVYGSNGNSVSINGLKPDTEYYYAIFEFNGSSAPVYSSSKAVSGKAKTTGGLPVTWISFTAKANDHGTTLEWATSSELNSAYFVVERSANPTFGFDSVSTIQAGGESSHVLKYSYDDIFKNPGNLYYRLKQVDLDGRFDYSRIVAAKALTNNTLRLFPNPATDKLYIQADDATTNAGVEIYNQSGRLVKSGALSENQSVDVQTLSPGTYFLMIKGQSKQYSKKFMKQ
ncbi:MAG: T9SS type A sorting domain-containing protein [Dyadobacter sp.]|uniref:T9SS type A sorting domain-containing protein n=1 Tax=Dyadobacter sp. TaxID=1914288 RepID=UPI003262F539